MEWAELAKIAVEVGKAISILAIVGISWRVAIWVFDKMRGAAGVGET